MPRVTYQQTNFTAGEISPRVHGRVDLDRYQNAAKQLLNAYPVIHGGARRRDGLRFLRATTESGDSSARLITFVYNRDDAYVLEFGDSYVRVHRAGTDEYITELATPYTASMLREIDYAQGADTMFLAHPSVPLYRLRRLSPSSFNLSPAPFFVEPFAEQGHIPATALTLSAATVGTGRTATAAASAFLPSDVGRQLVSGAGIATVTAYTSATVVTVDISTAFSGTALGSGSWTLDLSPQAFVSPTAAGPLASLIDLRGALTRAADLTLSAKTGSITVTASAGVFVVGDVGKRIFAGGGEAEITAYTSATVVDATVVADFEDTAYASGGYGITGAVWRAGDVGSYVRINEGLLQITSYTADSQVKARVLTELSSKITAPALSWSLESDVWTAGNGYPRTVTLHEQRLIAAGSNRYPQTVWGSRIGDYLDFSPGTADDDGYSFTLASDEVNPIDYVASLRTLVAHTYGGEFSLQGGIEKPITPTNVRIRPESSHGSRGVRPVTVGTESVFVQRAGRKVRAMGYRYDFDGYAAPDLAVLAEHITLGGITEMAFQQEPDSLLWAVRADGSLLSCTLDRDQGVTGWAKHTTDGQFESVASVPIGDRDETWVIVKREIEGAPVRYLERFESGYNSITSSGGEAEFECLDGPVWSLKSVPASTPYPALSVAVGDGIAVAVSGNPAVPYAIYSTDSGDTWNVATVNGFTGSPGGAYSPVYGGGWFFALVNAVDGMRSNDGQTWNAVSFPSTNADIAGYALGKFIIVGITQSIGIVYSSDSAATWTDATSLPTFSGIGSGVADDGTTAMVCGFDGGGGFVLTTTDCDTWARKSAPWTAATPNALACNGTRFVAVGQGNSGSNQSWYSDDAGDTWTAATIAGGGGNVWRDVIYNGGIFIAVCETTTEVAISQDGAIWTLSPNAMVTSGATSISALGNNYIAQRNTTADTIRVGRCTDPDPVVVPPDDDSAGTDLLINRFHVDSGKTYYSPTGITTLTGLDHLEGKAIDILADGSALPRQTVTGGAVTLPRTAYIVAAGLPYESRITTLTPEVGTGMGTAQGNNMRTSEVTLRLLETIGGKFQASGGQVQRIPFRQFGPDVLDAPPQPFTGLVRIEALGWDRGSSEVTLIQDQPLPMHVLSVIRKFTVND